MSSELPAHSASAAEGSNADASGENPVYGYATRLGATRLPWTSCTKRRVSHTRRARPLMRTFRCIIVQLLLFLYSCLRLTLETVFPGGAPFVPHCTSFLFYWKDVPSVLTLAQWPTATARQSVKRRAGSFPARADNIIILACPSFCSACDRTGDNL